MVYQKIFRPVSAREARGPGFSGPAHAGPRAARPVAISNITNTLPITLRVNRTNQERDSIRRGSLQPEGVYDNPSLAYERGSGEYEVPLATLSSAATAMDKDTTYEIIQKRDDTQTKM